MNCDRDFFSLVACLRRPAPGDNWSEYHLKTKHMMMAYLKETTGLTGREIMAMFGMEAHNGYVSQKTKEVAGLGEYQDFKKELKQML